MCFSSFNLHNWGHTKLFRLECIAFGYPVPYYNWTRINSEIPSDAIITNHNRVLQIPRVRVEDQGEYQCRAYNDKVWNNFTSFLRPINFKRKWSCLAVYTYILTLISVALLILKNVVIVSDFFSFHFIGGFGCKYFLHLFLATNFHNDKGSQNIINFKIFFLNRYQSLVQSCWAFNPGLFSQFLLVICTLMKKMIWPGLVKLLEFLMSNMPGWKTA